MDLFELSTTDPALIPATAKVLAFRGREALSEAFSYQVLFRISREEAEALDPKALLNQPATLRVRDRDGAAADVHGILWSVELLHGDEAVYVRVELSPRARRLQLARTSRVFTDTTIGTIVKDVLAEADVAGGAAFAGDPALDAAAEEHVCQYEESSWDFVARWLERLGTTFFFDHEGDEDKMVLLSEASKHPASSLERIKYDPKAGNDASAGRGAFEVRFARTGRLGKVRMRDGDYLNPSLAVEGESAGDNLGDAEWVHHGRRFFAPDAGADLARVVAEAELARSKTVELRTSMAPIHCGFTFELEGHPDADRNGELVATHVECVGWTTRWTRELELLFPLQAALGDASWAGPGSAQNGLFADLRAIPKGTPFRAPAVTPWPRIFGVETAVIDGEDGPYAVLDENGRYQIRFHFDERATESGRHSTLVRMSQPHAGSPEGWHFPLRNTTEVLVSFEDGDVDRPVIVAAVPDGAHPSVVTSANHTKNVFHTGSDNRLEIEDQAGSEWLHWRTPTESTYIHLGAHFDADSHNVVKHTDADLLFEIGTNQDVLVGGELREWVSGPVDEDYNTSQITIVLGPQTTTTSGHVQEDYDALQMTVVSSNVTELYKAGQKSNVTGTKIELYGSGHKTEVADGVTETYTGPHVKAVTEDVIQTYTGGLSRTVTGPVLQNWGSDVTLDWGATQATYAALVWVVPVDVTITAPRLDLFQLTKVSHTMKTDDIDWVKFEKGILETPVAMGKIEYQGLHYARIPFKADASGITIKIQAGPSLDVSIAHMEYFLLCINTAGGPQISA